MKPMWNHEEGSILPLVAVAFPALLAVAALALDVGYWYFRSTKMSNIADASAISGATALLPVNATLPLDGPANALTDAIGTVTTVIAPANADSVALKSGETAAVKAADVEFGYWNAGAASDGVCGDSGGSFNAGANYPGTINGHTTANAVRVSADHSNVPTFFYGVVTALFGGASDPFTISRCGVAERESVLSCFYIMNNADDAWQFNGNMKINPPPASPGCAIANNGKIDGNGNSNEVHSDYICTKDGSGDDEINADVPVDECGGALRDPYATYSPPNIPSNTPTGSPITVDGTSPPHAGGGIISGNNTLNNGTLTLNDGVYYIDGGFLDIGGSLVAHNSTIVLLNGGRLSVSGNGNMDLVGRDFGGITFAIVQRDNHVPAIMCNQSGYNINKSEGVYLGGTGLINMSGTIYLKTVDLNMQGGPTYTMDAVNGVSFVIWQLCMGGGGNGNLTIPYSTGPRVFTNVHLVQ